MAASPQNRLPQEDGRLFSGRLIKRDSPLTFKLNGHEYNGLEGDTVLSALLANGVRGGGQREGAPIALEASCCPPITTTPGNGNVEGALPMERTPVRNGMELFTFSATAGAGKVRRPFFEGIRRAISGAGRRNLDFDFSADAVLPGPWIDGAIARKHRVDVVVVGGGIAGMNAALAAAEMGKQVALVEGQSELGGEALFFGAAEGEPGPEKTISELASQLETQANVTIYTNALAFSLTGDVLKVHRVMVNGNEVRAEILGLEAKKIVLATGTLERLPVFGGNRLPGVMKARPAFHLAARYGVWPGKTAAVCTSSSAATRVALLAADLGINIAKLADSRFNPNSRFFEFAKAYGILLVSATQATGATELTNGQLSVTLGLTQIPGHQSERQNSDAFVVDRLIVCGGWQPDLTLWHQAGGQSRWDAERQELGADGSLENVVLAGSVAGFPGMTACGQHGKAVVLELFGLSKFKSLAITSKESFESGDGALPVAGHSGNPQNSYPDSSYLDSSYSFAKPAKVPEAGFLKRFLAPYRAKETPFTCEPRALGLNDIVAKVVLGEIGPEFAAPVAQERCVESRKMAIPARSKPGEGPATLEGSKQAPEYLRGRFGDRERVVELSADTEQMFEVGCLIYPDTTTRGPLKAIGVIIGVEVKGGNTALAYMNVPARLKNRLVVVRNNTHMLFARLPVKA